MRLDLIVFVCVRALDTLDFFLSLIHSQVSETRLAESEMRHTTESCAEKSFVGATLTLVVIYQRVLFIKVLPR